jgi:hypothetical protein
MAPIWRRSLPSEKETIMRLTLLVISLSALMLAGCASRVVERETVVKSERPAVVSASPRACTFGGSNYTHGSFSCQAGMQYSCNDGAWESRNIGC